MGSFAVYWNQFFSVVLMENLLCFGFPKKNTHYVFLRFTMKGNSAPELTRFSPPIFYLHFSINFMRLQRWIQALNAILRWYEWVPITIGSWRGMYWIFPLFLKLTVWLNDGGKHSKSNTGNQTSKSFKLLSTQILFQVFPSHYAFNTP